MNKTEAIKLITSAASSYSKHLDGNQVMFVYWDENNHTHYAEVKFRSHNFLHFTGVNLRQGLNAKTFYHYALNNRLSANDFSFKNNHTTELKLNILDKIMNIDKSARMIGSYIGSHIDLYTEKVTGTTTACLGLIEKNGCCYPNSILSEDIRNIVPHPPGKIYAIFKKKINAPLYTELTYKSQNLKFTPDLLPIELKEKIDTSLLNSN